MASQQVATNLSTPLIFSIHKHTDLYLYMMLIIIVIASDGINSSRTLVVEMSDLFSNVNMCVQCLISVGLLCNVLMLMIVSAVLCIKCKKLHDIVYYCKEYNLFLVKKIQYFKLKNSNDRS